MGQIKSKFSLICVERVISRARFLLEAAELEITRLKDVSLFPLQK